MMGISIGRLRRQSKGEVTMFIVRNRNRASGTEWHRVAQECHRCFPTANPRRGGGCRGFLQSVTTFLVNIKKGLLVVNGREKSVGVLIMVTIYIFILTTLI